MPLIQTHIRIPEASFPADYTLCKISGFLMIMFKRNLNIRPFIKKTELS